MRLTKPIILAVSICLSLHAMAFSSINPQANQKPKDFLLTTNCDPFAGGRDYRRTDPDTNQLRGLVEGAHFTDSVRRGISGNTTHLIEGDLEYVLNKFPNHAHALLLMANRQMEPDFKQSKPGRIDYLYPTKECYFRRALALAPDDGAVHLAIAIFYHNHENMPVAGRHYKDAVTYSPNNPEAHYNYGLYLLDVDQPMNALKHAEIAYQMGYPLEGLKNRLLAAKVWDKE